MDWKNIPSLSALRAFEATGRHGNQSHAARELNVSHAAIAQHIRALETHFQTKLMTRNGRGMSLTTTGQRLFTDCNAAFALIFKGTAEILEMNKRRPLTITLTPKFAESWLIPRISDFWENHPDIEVALRPAEHNVDLNDPELDLAIRFGTGGWAGTTSHALIPTQVVIVGSPKYLKNHRNTDLADLDWLVQSNESRRDRVMDMMHMVVEPKKTRNFATTGLLHQAIINGMGVGAMNAELAKDELQSGALEIIYEISSQHSLGYYLLTSSPTLNDNMKKFIKWVKIMVDSPPPPANMSP